MDLVFNELLVRRDTPHIMLREAQDIMNAMKNDFPEVVQIRSIGKTWEERSIDMTIIDGAEQVRKNRGGAAPPVEFTKV